jgi:hypothetical protein
MAVEHRMKGDTGVLAANAIYDNYPVVGLPMTRQYQLTFPSSKICIRNTCAIPYLSSPHLSSPHMPNVE